MTPNWLWHSDNYLVSCLNCVVSINLCSVVLRLYTGTHSWAGYEMQLMVMFSNCHDMVVDLDVDDMLTLLHSCQIDFVSKSKIALISRYFDYMFGEHVATLFWKPTQIHTPVPTKFQWEFVNMNFIFIDAATQMKHVPRSLKKGPMVTALKSIHPFMRPLFWRNTRTSCCKPTASSFPNMYTFPPLPDASSLSL